MLESLSLRQLSNQVLVTNKDGADNRALQAEAGEALASAIDQPGGPTVFVQTIGTVEGAGPEFEGIVKPLVRLGADPNLVNALDGSTSDGNPVGFAFVGQLGATEPPAESSNAYDRGPYPAPHYPAPRLTSWVLGLIGKVASLGGFAGPPVSAAASGLAATFGLASYLTTKSGEPIVGTEITARAEKLGEELVNRIELAGQQSERLGTILVSDYAKLTAANRHIDTDWALRRPWGRPPKPSEPRPSSGSTKR